jgi:acyl-CoA synthetase (AMP-forming)/AMP-acid ligase II
MFKKNIFSLIHKFNKKIAINSETQGEISYKKLLEDADIFRNYFKEKKIIMMLAENSYEFIVCYVAAIRSNQLLIILNPNINEKDLIKLCNLYKPHYIFAKKNINYLKYKKILNFKNFFFFGKTNEVEIPININLSCLLSTSGTTGVSKFVKLSSENLLSNTKSISKILSITSKDSCITTMPPYYSYALSIINTHLTNGSKIILNNYSIIDRKFWEIFKRFKPNNLNGVPYTYEILDKIKVQNMDLSCLKYITQAGGRLDQTIKKKYINLCQKKKIKFFIMYGQTEASPRISIMPWKFLKKYPDSVGLPLPGGRVIVKKKGSINNKEGEIIYKGKNVFWGYSNSYKDLKKNNEKNFFLKTGDIGYKNKKGFIFITGRKKRILKIFGIRLSLDILERELNQYNFECICSGTDKFLEVKVIRKKNIDLNKLRQKIKKITNLMPNFYKIIEVKAFERNEAGKIKY